MYFLAYVKSKIQLVYLGLYPGHQGSYFPSVSDCSLRVCTCGALAQQSVGK